MLPHKASEGDIIRARGLGERLFLVVEWSEEILHPQKEENVIYTCRDVDTRETKLIFDQDVTHVVAYAHQAEEFLAKRQPPLDYPVEKSPQERIQVDLFALMKHFEEAKKKREEAAKSNPKKILSPYEKERAEHREKMEYIDYLLDSHSMLGDLQELLGHDDMRAEEMRMLREEFKTKTAELFGERSK